MEDFRVRRACFLAALCMVLRYREYEFLQPRRTRLSSRRATGLDGNVVGDVGPEAANELATNLLNGSNTRFHDMFRMPQEVFRDLVAWLKEHTDLRDTRQLSSECQVMVFLWICAHNEAQRNCAHRFLLAQSTVSKIVSDCLPCFRQLHKAFVRPKPAKWLDERYELDEKVAFFNGCIGAIDGTHIAAHVPIKMQSKWRNRKGTVSQNVFAAVRSNKSFSFVMAGAEGSMSDQTLCNIALEKGFKIPSSRFYLGDAGFGLRRGILTPFPLVRYHLQDWRDAERRPRNAKELYNLRHARLRAVVEQAFGALKRKWKIIRVSAPEYSITDQIGFVYACTALQNFIEEASELLGSHEEEESDEDAESLDEAILRACRRRARQTVREMTPKKLRKMIAIIMWKEYRRDHRGVELWGGEEV